MTVGYKLLTSSTSFPLAGTQCLHLLEAFAQSRSLRQAKQLHAHIIVSGRHPPGPPVSCPPPSYFKLFCRLTAMYAMCGDVASARQVFDHAPDRTTFLWNNLIRAHARYGSPVEALFLFKEMATAECRPDKYTFNFVLKACADLSVRAAGVQLHCRAVVEGHGQDGHVQNGLISLYMNCGDTSSAQKVFDRNRHRSSSTWNSMMGGFVENGRPEEAVTIFAEMLREGAAVDFVTMLEVLPACGSLKDAARGKLVHDMACEKGFIRRTEVRNALIDMYAKCGMLEEARSLFDEGSWDKDVISWTAMIGGYALNGDSTEALALSSQMIQSGVRPNVLTVVAMLSACTSLFYIKCGSRIHGLAVRLILSDDIVAETALIDMYGRCGSMNISLLLFMKSLRRTQTWNAVMACYNRLGLTRETVRSFKFMLAADAECPPNLTTMMTVLPAYSDMSELLQARILHCYLIKAGFCQILEIATGLIDTYSKIGCLDTACRLFYSLPTKDVFSWTAIISACGSNGHSKAAIGLFHKMVGSGLKPNEATYISLLQSCSHAGLVDEGLYLFRAMTERGTLNPGPDHYVCIVDLLGRAGRLEEAHKLIEGMPFLPNCAVWGSLLGACVIHGNVELAEIAAMHLSRLEPGNTGSHVLLGNLYAGSGMWQDAQSVRKEVAVRGLTKVPACSLVESGMLDPSSIESKLEDGDSTRC